MTARPALRGDTLFARLDTPVHSVLHEASHYVCMTPERRAGLDRDAGGDDPEESAVCYLQILLADALDEVGSERLMQDMDAWGYSFRLGSTRAWFEGDAEDARACCACMELLGLMGRSPASCGHSGSSRTGSCRPGLLMQDEPRR